MGPGPPSDLLPAERSLSGKRLLRIAASIWLVFFLVMILTVLGLGHLPAVRLTRIEAPFFRAIRTGPFGPLVLSHSVWVRSAGIFLTNLRFLAVALVGAGLFRLRRATHRHAANPILGRRVIVPFLAVFGGVVAGILGWAAVGYFALAFLGNAMVAGVAVITSERIVHAGWPLVMLLGILPHGIFEIFAYALGFALLMAARTGRGVLRAPAFWTVLPIGILVLAALIEAGVTPRLIALLR